MGIRTRWLTRGALVAVCAIGLSACRKQTSATTQPRPAQSLQMEAERTRVAHMRAVEAGKEKRSGDEANIPESYWTDGIKALKPVKVYTHRVNVVVVQRVSDGVEHGKYIYVPVSSYIPISGDDGFTFGAKPNGDGSLDFTRTQGPSD